MTVTTIGEVVKSFVWSLMMALCLVSSGMDAKKTIAGIECDYDDLVATCNGSPVIGNINANETSCILITINQLTKITLSNCESSFDTTMSVANNNGDIISGFYCSGYDYDDDCGQDLCTNNSYSLREYFTMPYLQSGNYTILLGGYLDSNGEYIILIECDDYPQDEPVPAPTCSIGDNYVMDGQPAQVYGDPRFRTFNGDRHDYMGENGGQYYYMYPCYGSKREEMQFNLLGTHYSDSSSATWLDYIVLELYDTNGYIEYYVYLSQSLGYYAKQSDDGITSIYDANSNIYSVLGITNSIGQFELTYLQTDGSMKFVLIDTNTGNELSGTMTLGIMDNDRIKRSYLYINPPKNYECHTCGLFGDFKKGLLPGDNDVYIQKCNGDDKTYTQGVIYDSDKNYDGSEPIFWTNGMFWEKEFVETNCPRDGRRRLQDDDDEDVFADPQVPDDFTYIDPCDRSILENATDACQTARNYSTECCDLIGGGFCDELLLNCGFDACAGAQGNQSLISQQVDTLFYAPISFVCLLPDASQIFNSTKITPVVTPSPTQIESQSNSYNCSLMTFYIIFSLSFFFNF